ncbi:MAG: RDD family protein [Treponema sp.]|nr:RDD family protein [Treponema sp.]
MPGQNADSSLTMQTPEGIEYVLFPAGLVARICAWGIDTLIKGIVLLGLIILTSVVFEIFGIWFYFIMNFVLDWFYFTAFEMIWNGQTPGKRIIGIRVVSGDGSPVSAGSSFLRNLLRFADGFFYLYLIAFVCMAGSPGFRRIGDWAADTLVIYTSRSRLPGRFTASLQNSGNIVWLGDFPVQTAAHKLSYEEKQGLLMFARRYPLLGKKRADEIAKPWAALLRNSPSSKPDGVSDSEYLLGLARSVSGVNT